MADPLSVPTERLTREEFLAWVLRQPKGRFERLHGQAVAMAPERGAHLRAKAATWAALRDAIRARGLDCEALPDGATVVVDADTDFEPDAVVTCGARIGADETVAPNPTIVVEVVSPSSRSIDSGVKLAGYFRVPSIQHYLIVETTRRLVIHHQRLADGTLSTRILASGPILLDPPGLTVAVEALFAD